MAKKTKEYKKLPGRGRRFMSHHTLYMGVDHLLAVNRSVHQEDYKRFYYKDIQSIIARKTHAGKIGNVVILLLAASFGLLAYISDPAAIPAFLVAAGSFLGVAAINTIMSPTCKAHIKTAVQTEKLPSLIRMRMVKKTLDRVRPKIVESQGVVDQAKIEELWALPEETEARPKDVVLKHETGLYHKILFALMLIDGLVLALTYNGGGLFFIIFRSVVTLAVSAAAIIALIRQHGGDLPGSVQTLTWAGAGYAAANYVVGVIIYMAVIMDDMEIVNNQVEIWRKAAEMTPSEQPWLGGVWLFLIISAFVIGAFGLVLSMRTASSSKNLEEV